MNRGLVTAFADAQAHKRLKDVERTARMLRMPTASWWAVSSLSYAEWSAEAERAAQRMQMVVSTEKPRVPHVTSPE